MPEPQTTHHVTLARKYRPQRFEEVVAQEHVTRTLANAVRSGRLANAYLFVGPRGVGKTTLARIYAKAINCEKGPTAEPCNRCEACLSISEGRCLDVLEFDAASNTQVDRVREIILDNIGFRPAHVRYRVFIVDEVHMLSISSFNALLKTLEEPPPHVKFVFATTEPQKIPPTILSRCQRFDLRRIPVSAISQTLEKIAKAEGVDLEPDAALAIARGAEGGLRDAESVLDQLISFCGNTIRESDVLSVFGLVSWAQMQNLVDAVLSGDAAGIFRLIAEMDAAGKDLMRVSVELLDYIRDLMVVSCTGRLLGESEAAGESSRLDLMRAQASRLDLARLSRIGDILVEVQAQMRYSLSRRTLLELALVRAARTASSVSLEDVLVALESSGSEAEGSTVSAPRSPSETPPTNNSTPMASAPDSIGPTPAGQTERVSALPKESKSASYGADAMDDEASLRLLLAKWPTLLDQLGAVNPAIRSGLKDAHPVAVQGNRVRISFDPEFSESCERVRTPRNQAQIQKAIEKMLRRPVIVEFSIGEPPVETPSTPQPQTVQSSQDAAVRVSRLELVDNPAVRRTIDLFNGDIAEIRE
ncbi:MAG: DNA polymerase III subunit gamma/tau [Kiritimatiellae bacterium]|nr:DNA polymerase III subunit gamma/tau [Kiritimatiellia bacterium]MDW8459341.1 DNA polymerase III subunit gamma/tau [Verrucomicrobiota bacterium]